MKSFIITFCLLLTAITIDAQREEYTWDYITFEEPYRFLEIDSSGSNAWKIGSPDKYWHYNSFAGLNSIYTYGDAGYPVNNHSTFTLTINGLNMDNYPYSVYLEFMHQLDTEKNKDGGYITVSYDGGDTWTNIIEDRSACISPMDGIETEGLYSRYETLHNGEYGYSGKINYWTKVRFGWEECLAKSSLIISDSMLLRFHFISDGHTTSQKGWNIDHIRLFSMPLTGSSGDDPGMSFRITPNPATDRVEVTVADGSPVDRITLFDITGKCRGTFEGTGDISLLSYPAGIYYMKIEAAAGKVFRKILKQ